MDDEVVPEEAQETHSPLVSGLDLPPDEHEETETTEHVPDEEQPVHEDPVDD